MKDRIIRGTAKDGEVRFFAAVTTELVEKASKIHNCTPTAAAALGRVLTATSMMGTMLKNDSDSITVKINGGGEAGTILAVGNSKGIVKGYIVNPEVHRPLNSKGKLDVGGVIGKDGYLTVIRDLGLKDPYIGQVPIVSGEIAEDITYYYATSEQVPSAVSLGVLVGTNNEVISSGGFIIQMMPDASDFTRDIIEFRLDEIPPVTQMVQDRESIMNILDELLDGMAPRVLEEYTPEFKCECNIEKIERMLISLGKEELKEMAEEGRDTEIICHFCNEAYNVTPGRLTELLNEATRG